jgi:hypothetical protein
VYSIGSSSCPPAGSTDSASSPVYSSHSDGDATSGGCTSVNSSPKRLAAAAGCSSRAGSGPLAVGLPPAVGPLQQLPLPTAVLLPAAEAAAGVPPAAAAPGASHQHQLLPALGLGRPLLSVGPQAPHTPARSAVDAAVADRFGSADHSRRESLLGEPASAAAHSAHLLQPQHSALLGAAQAHDSAGASDGGGSSPEPAGGRSVVSAVTALRQPPPAASSLVRQRSATSSSAAGQPGLRTRLPDAWSAAAADQHSEGGAPAQAGGAKVSAAAHASGRPTAAADSGSRSSDQQHPVQRKVSFADSDEVIG